MPICLPEDRFSKISSVNEHLVNLKYHAGPVTSLKFHREFLLCGYGPILKVFAIENHDCRLIWEHQIFKRNKIHCIAISPDGERVAIAGARSFAVLKYPLGEQPRVIEKRINEWVTACEFLDNNTLLILNSHNTVYRIDVSDIEKQKFNIVEYIHCNEKSILYSGSIRVQGSKCIVAAGTVMDGVLVWDLNSREILHELKDHKGSIFGVKIDEKFNHIVSCSDDRSIKLYEFQTGNLLAEGWGHGSRIWNLDFFDDNGDVRLMSAGEDCTVRFWQYVDQNPELQQLDVIDDCHLGKHVWASSIDSRTHNLAASGGADGRVRLHDLKALDQRLVKHSVGAIVESAGIQFAKKEVIKVYYSILKLNYLIAVTSNGKLLCLHQKTSRWSAIPLSENEEERLSGFSVIRGFEHYNTVFVISRDGGLLQLDFSSNSPQPVNRKWHESEHLEGNKVTNLLAAYEANAGDCFLFIDCPNAKIPFLLKRFNGQGDHLTFQSDTELKQPDQSRFTTSCVLFDCQNNWLMIGSRYCSLCIYDLHTKECKVFKKITPGDTITSVASLSTSTNSLSILIAVRDGVYAYLSIVKDSDFKVEVLHQNKISRGFVEGAYVDQSDLILYGFRSNYFYVWNETRQLEVMKELCGGSHRKWEFFHHNDSFQFAYLSKDHLVMRSHKDRFMEGSYGLLCDGTHGREIRDVAISHIQNDDQSKLILTASEDTIVRLGKLYKDGTIKSYWCMNDHISGLQRVNFLNASFAASSAANEEFFIWKISSLADTTPVMKLYARLEVSAANPDLRIMDFSSVETDTGFIISTVYSDSAIKVWDFDIESNRFTCLKEDFYAKCCLLNVKLIYLEDCLHLLIGATDGHIAIWKLDLTTNSPSNLHKPIIKQQLHQSGVKAMEIQPEGKSSFQLITGGDDNALVLSKISQQNGELALTVVDFVEVAASATITSVSLTKTQQALVTSVDQVLRVWDFQAGKLECVSATYTTVADTGCSDFTEIMQNQIVVIGGAGISSWGL